MKSILSVFAFCAATAMASPIGLVFTMDPNSQVRSDFNGDGVEETFATVTTSANINMWFDPFPNAQMSTADGSRYYSGTGLTFENMFLDPTKQHLTGSNSISNGIGFQFQESFYTSVNGTHYQGGQRIDESVSMYAYMLYSNDVAESLPGWVSTNPWDGHYETTLDVKKTLENLTRDPRASFYFDVTVVWSDPITYRYEKHSEWTGSGRITSLISDPSAPEPGSLVLIGSGILGLVFSFRRHRQNR